MKFSVKDFFSKGDQIRSHLLKKSLMENFIFCAVFLLSKYASKHADEQLFNIEKEGNRPVAAAFHLITFFVNWSNLSDFEQ